MKRELLIEMAQIAVRSIRGNRLRTGLTIGIIGLGIMALISMTTATSSLEANVVEQFSSLGTDVFGTTNSHSSRQFQPICYKRVVASYSVNSRFMINILRAVGQQHSFGQQV